MNQKIFPVKITRIIEEAQNVKTYRLTPINGEKIDFLPGQFVFLYVKIGKEKLKRAYSIASSPLKKKYIDLTIKRTLGGKVTPHILDSVKIGDFFEISNPQGKFNYSEDNGNNITLIAGGTGIVPFISILRYCTEKKLDTNITLFYSAKNEELILYRKELEKLEKINTNLKIIYTLTQTKNGWKGHRGRIDKEFITQNINVLESNMFYLCGPLGLIRDTANTLISLGVDRKKIKRDVWS